MSNEINYFVGGASWNGNDRTEEFLEGGYWEVGGKTEKFIKRTKKMKKGDRIALKTTRTQEPQALIVKAIGIIKLSNPKDEKQVFVDWKLKNINRHIQMGLGEYVKRIYGPITDTEIIKDIFRF